MLAYMERTGVCPRQILYIGDSIYDMQCAAQAGVDSCLALWGCHCPDGILSTHRFEEPAGMMHRPKSDFSVSGVNLDWSNII